MKTVTHFGIEVEDVSNFIENETNIYSQAHQDLFALGISNYNSSGTFVDIACGPPRDVNNTYFLEQFGWTGLSLDIKNYEHLWQNKRINKFLHCNALEVNYNKLFKSIFTNNKIDYLSLDADDATNDILSLLPFNDYEFNTITIEHDLYATGDHNKKQQQTSFLQKNGYIKIAENICVYEKYCIAPFEDWWVSNTVYQTYKNIFKQNQNQYVYSDEFLNKCGFYINRHHLLKNKKEILNNCITLENKMKCLATVSLDDDCKEIDLKNRPKIIYISGKWLDVFIEKILPKINYPFYLLSFITDNKQIHNKNNLFKNNYLLQCYTNILLDNSSKNTLYNESITTIFV